MRSRNRFDGGWDYPFGFIKKLPEAFGKTQSTSTTEKKKFMKTKILRNILSPHSLSRLRLVGASMLVIAAAAAVAASMMPPKLPWAVPTITIADNPVNSHVQGIAVDPVTNTIYVGSSNLDNTVDNSVVKVIDGSKCSAANASRCAPIATMTNVGPTPVWLTFDGATGTLYVTNGLTTDYNDGQTITVLNAKICNAKNTSGCNQLPVATVTTPGFMSNSNTGNVAELALDPTTHTLYIGDAHDGFLSFIDASICNAMDSSGCGQAAVITGANGDGATISVNNNTVYVADNADQVISVLNYSTCTARNHSNCAALTTAPYSGPVFPSTVDDATQTIYFGIAGGGVLGSVAILDANTCNASNISGCNNLLQQVPVGSFPFQVLIDPTTKTAYVESEINAAIAVINTATCNARNFSGCPAVPPPALATGDNPTINIVINPNTHTLYSQSEATNRVWVFDTRQCNATHTSTCTKFAPTTTVGVAPGPGIVDDALTTTLYVVNQSGSVSIVDTRVCNQHTTAGCNHTWPTITDGLNGPYAAAMNRVTNTLYVTNVFGGPGPGYISVFDANACNAHGMTNCAALGTIPIGVKPRSIAIDESTNTIYVVNFNDDDISIVDARHCNAADATLCNQVATASVGAGPAALGFSPVNQTIYVANQNDDTVSVIGTDHCKGSDTSDCSVVATVPVGAAPRAVGIVDPTNSVFIGNRDDLTVSVFDSSTCNGHTTSGCPQTPPPAFIAGAFPDTAGNEGHNIFSRALVFDAQKHTLYFPVSGDSDLAAVDTNPCRAGHVDACHVKIAGPGAGGRAGGLALSAAVDDSTETVYVVNDDDGTVSIFHSSF
jgi:YVTN family beta-propeller protein